MKVRAVDENVDGLIGMPCNKICKLLAFFWADLFFGKQPCDRSMNIAFIQVGPIPNHHRIIEPSDGVPGNAAHFKDVLLCLAALAEFVMAALVINVGEFCVENFLANELPI